MIHIQEVHLITDRPLSEAQIRAVTGGLAADVNSALKTACAPTPRVRIRELKLQAPGAALMDRVVKARTARSVAARILNALEG